MSQEQNEFDSQESVTSYGQTVSAKFKIGTPIYQKFETCADIFSVTSSKIRMESLENAKLERNKYLELIERKGGDIHYYKKQTFCPGFIKVTKKGIMTPHSTVTV